MFALEKNLSMTASAAGKSKGLYNIPFLSNAIVCRQSLKGTEAHVDSHMKLLRERGVGFERGVALF